MLLSTRARIAGPLALGAWLVVACDRTKNADEEQVRRELGVPSAHALEGIESSPKRSGFFGREGLRIVATFRLTESEFEAMQARWTRSPGWQPLPLPAAVTRFRDPPQEVLTDRAGSYLCFVGTWRTGQHFEPHPCSAPPPSFAQYRVAVYEPARGRLTVVSKNYY